MEKRFKMFGIGFGLCWLLLASGLAGCGDPCADQVDRAFLAKVAAEEGVVRTKSGLIYKELTEGYGPKPQEGDKVTVHYHGTLIDGTVFDSSLERGYTSTFPLDNVIPGWSEALLMMKGGGKARLVIPPHLGYGQQGNPGKVPPCAVLIFEVELFGIKEG